MSVTITCYGSVEEIGGNKILVEDGETRIMLDFGIGFSQQGRFFNEFLRPRSSRGLFDPLALGLLPPLEGLYRKDLERPGMWDRHRNQTGYRYLNRNKQPAVDAIVISHSDIDHINGIPEIAAHRRVGHVYAHGAFFSRDHAGGTARRLIECLDKHGHTIEQIPELFQAGAIAIETLWPLGRSPDPNDLSDNDRSLVSRVQFAGVSVLLCSDIEELAQQHIMAVYPKITAQIVVVPHHGSTATRHEPFLASLEPEILLTSCGRKRGDRPPTPPPGCQARQFSTPVNGAVTVCVQGNSMVIVTPHIESSTGD